jgi:hypothetical protein
VNEDVQSEPSLGAGCPINFKKTGSKPCYPCGGIGWITDYEFRGGVKICFSSPCYHNNAGRLHSNVIASPFHLLPFL